MVNKCKQIEEMFRGGWIPRVGEYVDAYNHSARYGIAGTIRTTVDHMLTSGVSNSQLYKQAGNSIVVDNLMAIFESLLYPDGEQCKPKAGTQLTLW